MPEPQVDLRVLLGWADAGVWLALPKGVGCEILIDTPLAHLPGAPPSIAGLIHRQGAVLPVLRFSDPWKPDAGGDPRLLVLSRGRERLALQTDAQPDFAAISASPDALPHALPESLGLPAKPRLWTAVEREDPAVEWDPFLWSRGVAA
jgi:hypothetical protein